MAISDRDRKLLWARSGNRCAFPGCKTQLTHDTATGDAAFPVGEEAHIVGRTRNGPRGDHTFPLEAPDAYDNLILLCPTHHRIIDEDTETYTVDVLCKMKADHEQWVREAIAAYAAPVEAPSSPAVPSDVRHLERVSIPDLGLLYDVFLSYKSEDEPFARRLKEALEARGLRVWLDRDEIRPGDIFPQALERGIRSSRAVAILVSPSALASPWVIQEYYQALALENTGRYNVRIIPLVLRDAQLPGFLSVRQWVDFRDESRFEASLDELRWGITGLRQPLSPGPTTPRRARVTTPSVQHPPIPSVTAVSLAKLPVTAPDLFDRESELRILDRAWADPHTHIVALIGFGGTGKSAIINHWLRQMEKGDFRGAHRVFGWSFYSQGTSERTVSADQFIHSALIFFGDPKPEEGSPWDKGQRLAQLIRQQPTLLILDGLEPLQSGPGPQEGEFKDRAGSMYPLLRELSHSMDGLCLLSSRVDITDVPLSDALWEPGPPGDTPAALRVNLERLSTDAGRALLKHFGTKGLDPELDAAVEQYDGHALALVLLAGYLSHFMDGDIAGAAAIPILPRPTLIGAHSLRVMEAYDIALKRDGREPERGILRLLGLFDRPASKGCLDTLRRAPAIEGVTDSLIALSDLDWRHAIGRLRKWRLLSRPRGDDDGSLDAHPLVREYFGQKLEQESPQGFRQAHSRLYECLRDTTKLHPNTLEEMEPLLGAVRHGCYARRHTEALYDVYFPRVHRGGTLARALGRQAYAADLAVLSCFFERPWRKALPGIPRAQERLLLNAAGLALLALGRPTEGAEAFTASLDHSKKACDWSSAAAAAANLADIRLATGPLAQAIEAGRLAVNLADRVHETSLLIASSGQLASACRLAGRLVQARDEFLRARAIQSSHDPSHPVLDGLVGVSHRAFLLETGDPHEARRQASLALESAWHYGWRPDALLARTSLGAAFTRLAGGRPMLEVRWPVSDMLQEAVRDLDLAIAEAREICPQYDIPLVLLARASFHRDFGDREQAERDLEEALELSTRIGLRLHETDARLLEGHMALDLDPPDTDTAQQSLGRAHKLVEETGYHLRDADLLILQGRLLAKQGNKDAGRAKLEEAITVARREPDAVYQLAVDQAERYLNDL